MADAEKEIIKAPLLNQIRDLERRITCLSSTSLPKQQSSAEYCKDLKQTKHVAATKPNRPTSTEQDPHPVRGPKGKNAKIADSVNAILYENSPNPHARKNAATTLRQPREICQNTSQDKSHYNSRDRSRDKSADASLERPRTQKLQGFDTSYASVGETTSKIRNVIA